MDGSLLDVDHIEFLGETALVPTRSWYVDDVRVWSCRLYDEGLPPPRRELGVDWSLGEVAYQHGLLGLEVCVPGARVFIVASSLLFFFVLRVLPSFLP